MNHPENIAWLVLLLPLAAMAVILLFTRADGRFSAGISIVASLASFVISLALLAMFGLDKEANLGQYPGLTQMAFDWLAVGPLKVSFDLRLDYLSLLMALVVTGVGSAIQIYSFGYMQKDRDMGRYFGGLSLFTFSMLGIVFATNLVMLFIFWELVGVSSYLLIGHWYERAAAGDAAKKAFLVNRLGDFGFLLGILLIWGMAGTVNLEGLQNLLQRTEALGTMSGVAGLLIFCGVLGKSAQFPLHVWLPDAMEGPTPVSALIHAATMVAAGVYLLCRLYFIYTTPPAWPEPLAFLAGFSPLDFIAWTGGATALLAALMAVQQNDIKRILAYSTLSQLGYMVMAVGLASPGPAMFHLCTHAFFKALLFLAAGSVIHALHHEQDIWRMGALRKRMPVTWMTFLVGTLALCGLPPLSGFYSKDFILAAALDSHHGSPALFALAVAVAALTSFYMFRLVFVAFLGSPKNPAAETVRESGWVMTGPLLVLAFFSAVAGLIGIPEYLGGMKLLTFEGHAEGLADRLIEPFRHSPLAAGSGLAAAVIGMAAAWRLYGQAQSDPLPQKLGLLAQVLRQKFYFDEIYQGLIELTHEALARTADWLDRWIISGLGVRGAHGTTEFAGRALRLLQTGNLQTYAFLFAAGALLLLWWRLKW